MAKEGMKQREVKRKKLAQKYAGKRACLQSVMIKRHLLKIALGLSLL